VLAIKNKYGGLRERSSMLIASEIISTVSMRKQYR
jgi:hypothetical protein